MTLTEVSYYARKIVPPITIGFVVFLIIAGIVRVAISRNLPKTTTSIDPLTTPIPRIDPVFGNLSKIVTSSKIDYPPNPTFVLDTIEGKPVGATESAKIFFLLPKPVRYGYLQTAYLMAKSFGFDTTTVKHRLDGTQAIFEDSDKKAAIDITTFNFEYKYQYENNTQLFTNSILPTDTIISEAAKQFLRSVNKYPEELTQGHQETIYMHYDTTAQTFTVVKKPEEANAVEVDFYRPDIEGLSVRPPRYFNSQNFVVMVFINGVPKVIKAQLKFFDRDAENYGSYPLKTGEEAYRELTQGLGLIVSSGQSTNKITVNKMSLAYFDPDIQQQYLQPVYVFLSNNGFAAYVPAVKSSYVE